MVAQLLVYLSELELADPALRLDVRCESCESQCRLEVPGGELEVRGEGVLDGPSGSRSRARRIAFARLIRPPELDECDAEYSLRQRIAGIHVDAFRMTLPPLGADYSTRRIRPTAAALLRWQSGGALRQQAEEQEHLIHLRGATSNPELVI